MTITYPRDLPAAFPVRSVTFQPQFVHADGASRGGIQHGIELGRPYWSVRYETVPMNLADGLALLAWLNTLNGGLRFFKAWHPLLPYVQAYPNGYDGLTKAGGGAFTGEAVLETVGPQADTITISGLPAGFPFEVGDKLSFAYGGGRQALHEVVEATIASGAGEATIAVFPTVIPGWTADTPVALARAWFKAKLDRSSVTGPWQSGRRCAVTFKADQTHGI